MEVMLDLSDSKALIYNPKLPYDALYIVCVCFLSFCMLEALKPYDDLK